MLGLGIRVKHRALRIGPILVRRTVADIVARIHSDRRRLATASRVKNGGRARTVAYYHARGDRMIRDYGSFQRAKAIADSKARPCQIQ